MLTASFRGNSPPQPHMQRRGRSRHISPVALARQASEERRRSLPASIQSGKPLPPTPQSPQDQDRAACAPDDDRLARGRLLDVTDDKDLRIDQVRDEDCDVCSAPARSDDKRALQETRRAQWWHESERTQRLRACEKLWEDEKHRLHIEKQRALHRREHEHERIRLAESRAQQPRATRVMSRSENLSAGKRHEDPFQYAFMLPSRPSSSTLPAKSHKKTSGRSPGRHNRSVSFKEVINAMNGQLFPLDPSERADDARRIAGVPIPNSTSHRRKASMRAELLDSLLQVVEWQQGERRKAKGKDVARDQQTVKPQPLAPTPVSSVPSSLSATSLASSASPSRCGSWLTFGSWRSSATDITTPESPVPGSPASSQPCLPTLIETQRELHPRCAFVRISVEESPLCPSITPHPSVEDEGPCVGPSGSTVETSGIREALVQRVSRSVATIIEAAKGLQSAYIAATIFTAGHPTVTPSQPPGSMRCQRQARREGYRALAKDVRKFTDCTSSDVSQTSEPVHFIPLVSQPSGSSGLPKPPVPKNVVIFPSPLRPRTPPNALAYRMRPVANPAVLRLRALQNLMCARGKEWEGRAREGGLGCGKERMVGIAFEGRGRSGLGCEVRFVVA